MSYQANLDIVIAMNLLRIASFRKQGRLRFRIKLLHDCSDPQQSKKSKVKNEGMQEQPVLPVCSPYNIYKQKEHQPMRPIETIKQRNQARSSLSLFYPREEQAPEIEQSYIDFDEECYYSRVFESKFVSQHHPIEECCYFRRGINTDKLQQSKLIIRVDLFFRPLSESDYVTAGSYEATIYKLSGFTSFLPITFDEFGGFTITGTYQATILQYHFSIEDEEQSEFDSFDEYLKAATMGFRSNQFLKFFSYYRSSLESELNAIQSSHSTLLGVVCPNSFFTFVKVNPNPVMPNIAMYLSEASDRSLNNVSSMKGLDDLKERATHQISKDFVQLKALIHQKWNQYIIFLLSHLPVATEYYGNIYKEHVSERLRTHAFSHKIEQKWDWTFSRYQDSGKAYLEQAEMDKLKKQEEELWRDQFPIQTKYFFEDEGKTIKIFEEVYPVRGPILTQRSLSPGSGKMQMRRFISHQNFQQFPPPPHSSPRSHYHLPSEHYSNIHAQFGQINPNFHVKQSVITEHPYSTTEIPKLKLERLNFHDRSQLKKGEHIVIFVHGFQASRQDFVLFKSCLEIKYNCRVFISSTNEGRTDDSIQILGKRLAIQLNNFFKTIDFGPGTRLSFIGHSMGGIIIRSALSYIKNLQPYLYTYMSFSSPHLGYLYQPSALVQAGLWLLNAWQKVNSLDQLCMRDNSDPRKTLIYRLSENNSLKGFQQLSFLSSSQDEYVPYQSARVQKNPALMSKIGAQNASVIKQMVDNILGDIRAEELSRMNVVFNIEDRNFDSLVGRTAHIKYLSDQKFIKMFCLVFEKFFI